MSIVDIIYIGLNFVNKIPSMQQPSTLSRIAAALHFGHWELSITTVYRAH